MGAVIRVRNHRGRTGPREASGYLSGDTAPMSGVSVGRVRSGVQQPTPDTRGTHRVPVSGVVVSYRAGFGDDLREGMA